VAESGDTRATASRLKAELERLRRLEQELGGERERIRTAAAQEVARLQAALRETAARADQREQDVRRLAAELERSGRGRRRARGLRHVTPESAREDAGQIERMRAALEERARALAETETRQQVAQAALVAERERLAEVDRSLEPRRALRSELNEARKRIESLERALAEHNETRAGLTAARAELVALGVTAQKRREAEAALVAARARIEALERASEAPSAQSSPPQQPTQLAVEGQIAAMLAGREKELARQAEEELARRRAELEQEMEASLAQHRAELEQATASREQSREATDDRLARDQAELRAEIAARERELALREAAVADRERQFSLLRRRLSEEKRRLEERAWRTGALGARRPSAAAVGLSRDLTFEEGLRALEREPGAHPSDGQRGSW
jgi:hypothetical protein